MENSKLLSIEQLIDQIKLSNKETVDSLRLYLVLRDKIRKNNQVVIDFISNGTLFYLLDNVKALPFEDLRKSIAFEIFNDILYNKEGKQYLNNNEQSLKTFINIVIEITNDWLLSKSNYLKTDEEAFLLKVEELNLNDSFETQTELDEARKKDRMKVWKACEEANGYKSIITIGLLATDNVIAQTYICDRLGMDLLIDLIYLYNDSQIITKWCLWSCINLTYEHPPNKREFYIKNGIPIILKSMKSHRNSVEINQQGFALLFCILNDDPYTKINLHLARTQALSNGLTDVSYHASRIFESNKLITSTIDAISQIIYKDWT